MKAELDRLNFLKQDYSTRIKKLLQKGKLQEHDGHIFDITFRGIVQHYNNRKITPDDYNIWATFDFLYQADTTPTKGYLQWLINLYLRQIKDRYPFDHDKYNQDLDVVGGERARFFEDVQTLSEEFNRFEYIKKTKILTPEERDINTYKSISEFKFKVKQLTGSFSDNAVDCLSPQEHNLINTGKAEIIVNDKTHILVLLHTKEAARLFGRDSVWCTAANVSSQFANMFDSYSNRGVIMLLINKSNADNQLDRVQIHIPTSQVMDIQNRHRSIHTILKENEKINDYLFEMIIKDNMQLINNLDGLMNVADKFGIVIDSNNILDIVKKGKITTIEIDFNKFSLSIDELLNLNQIKSLILVNTDKLNINISTDNVLSDLIIKRFYKLTLKIDSDNQNLKKISLLNGSINELNLPKYVNMLIMHTVNYELDLDFNYFESLNNLSITKVKIRNMVINNRINNLRLLGLMGCEVQANQLNQILDYDLTNMVTMLLPKDAISSEDRIKHLKHCKTKKYSANFF